MPSKYAAQSAWEAQNTTRITLKLSHLSDADILAWFEGKPSKQGAIKALIRKEIEKEKK